MSDNTIIRRPTTQDINYLIENMREIDRIEMDDLMGVTPAEALIKTPNIMTNSWILQIDDKPICIFGVTPRKDDKRLGVIWLLGTNDFDENAKTIAFLSKHVLEQLISAYDYVFNYVHSKNKKSIRWLKWMGFRVCDAEPIGRKGANFHLFDMHRCVIH